MHVFTYGSLMFPDVWGIVVGREFETVAGKLPEYANYRVRNVQYPGIIAQTGAEVPGLLYLDVDDRSIERLDRFEGEFYERQSLAIECVDGQRRMADAYVVPERSWRGLTADRWTAEWFASSGALREFIARYEGFSWLGGDG